MGLTHVAFSLGAALCTFVSEGAAPALEGIPL